MGKCSVAGCNNPNHKCNQVKDLKNVCLEHFFPEDIRNTYPIESDLIDIRVNIYLF